MLSLKIMAYGILEWLINNKDNKGVNKDNNKDNKGVRFIYSFTPDCVCRGREFYLYNTYSSFLYFFVRFIYSYLFIPFISARLHIFTPDCVCKKIVNAGIKLHHFAGVKIHQ